MKPTGFVWDSGNKEKNWVKHKVSEKECEEIFSDREAIVFPDSKHSTEREKRFMILGVTAHQRKLVITYTVRNHLVRVISARDQSRRERRLYEKKAKTN